MSKLKAVCVEMKFCLAALICAILYSRAEAGTLSLTSSGASEGFTLSVFADGFTPLAINPVGEGPLGMAFPSGGGVLVSNVQGEVRLFTDVDGQHAGSVVPVNYGAFRAEGMTTLGGVAYMNQLNIGQVIALNNNGTLNHVVATGIVNATGIVGDPFNGHLFVSAFSAANIREINAANGAIISSFGTPSDGVALSADGKTLYAADLGTNQIVGYDTTSHAVVFQSSAIAGLDGTALGAGLLNGFIYANTNFGEVWEINLANPALQTLIASGGSRGDFVSVDPNGTLLLTQSDSIYRLTAPLGGAFGTLVPLPPAALAGGSLLACMGVYQQILRRRKNQGILT